MHGTAVGLSRSLPGQEIRLPPAALCRLCVARTFCRLRVLLPSLPAGGRLLGRSFGCGNVRIPVGQCRFEHFFQVLRYRGGFLRLLAGGLGLRLLGLWSLNTPQVFPVGQSLRSAANSVQSPGLDSTHCRQQHPVAHAVRLPAQKLPAVKIPAQSHGLQILFQGLGGVGHHQPILCPGHGNVEHPHFLGNTLSCHSGSNGSLGKSWVAHPGLPIHRAQTKPQLLVAENLRPQILLIEPPGKVAQEHHRKFQTFGLVNAHNTDAVCPRRAGNHQPPLLHPVQVIQERRQRSVCAVFKVTGILKEGLQILRPGLAPGHGREKAVQPGFRQRFFQQSRQGAVPGFPAKQLQYPEEFLRLWLPAFQQGIVKTPLGLPCPDFCQIVCGKAEYRTCQNAEQRDVLPGILNRLQKASQGLHLPGLQQIRSAPCGATNAPVFQRPLEISGGTARRAQENHNILRPHRPQTVLFPDQSAVFQHFLNPSGNEVRLLGVSIGDRFQCVELHPRLRQPHMGHALPKSLRFGVVQPPHLRGHAGGEYLVHPFNNLRAGTEIVAEQHLPALPRLCFLRFKVVVVFFQENSRVCQPELIDRLLHVTD